MRKLILVLGLLSVVGCKTLGEFPNEQPSPIISVAPSPKISESPIAVKPAPSPMPKKSLITLKGVGPSVDAKVVQTSFDLLNEIYANGCLERKVKAWSIPYLENAENKKYADKITALNRFFSKAPYAIEIHWYNTNSTVMGYTYTYKMISKNKYDYSKTEDRIWTNRTNVYGPKTYAAHLAHELTHPISAGGFTHIQSFQGSVPYETGDMAWECLMELPSIKTFGVTMKKQKPENWEFLKANGYTH